MSLSEEASRLVSELADRLEQSPHRSLFSPVIYDTAWAAMISKVQEDGHRCWLFPECFRIILQDTCAAEASGSNISRVDGILNATGVLLAILKHRDEPLVRGSELPPDLNARICDLVRWIDATLQEWDVATSDHVGFELLVPTLLRLLRQHDIVFDFPGAEVLATKNREKLGNFDISSLYSPAKSTLVHSLEAFVGMLDFDKVKHHLHNGSMMASPSSTAAYLVHTSEWDDEAEAYMRRAFVQSEGFASAAPTTIFECSWVMSTLLGAGFTVDDLGPEKMSLLADFLESNVIDGHGTLGFAPGIMADADDTARSLMTLSLMGRHTMRPDKLILEFEADESFRTYATERNRSLSANCNVLMALLSAPDPSGYSSQINKAAGYLCSLWWHGQIRDKWNLSEEYPTMLLAQSFIRLSHVNQTDSRLSSLEKRNLHLVSVVLAQILTKTMQRQNLDGSWGERSPETTAYATLTLLSLAELQWTDCVRQDLAQSTEKGRAFIRAQSTPRRPDFLWVEKVTHSSPVLSKTYCLAALNGPVQIDHNTNRSSAEDMSKAIHKGLKFFSRIPLFNCMPQQKLTMALLQSGFFLPLLQEEKTKVFPPTNVANEKYLEYVPFTWLGCNLLRSRQVNNEILWEMMVISMLNYQIDDYMESVVGKLPPKDFDHVKRTIVHFCEGHPVAEYSNGTIHPQRYDNTAHLNGYSPEQIEEAKYLAASSSEKLSQGALHVPRPWADTHTNGLSAKPTGGNGALPDIEKTITRFIEHASNHACMISKSTTAQAHLKKSLSTFLLAHMTQIEDSHAFSLQQPPLPHRAATFLSATKTYHSWVRSTGADHTSCPYSFWFFTHLISDGPLFHTPKQKYLAHDVALHLATLCRMYNDYGSIERDADERNVNSVNFPDMETEAKDDGTKHRGEVNGGGSTGEEAWLGQRKKDLLALTEYERECLDLALTGLRKEVSSEVMERIMLFVDVTNLYGQIYLARDIGMRQT